MPKTAHAPASKARKKRIFQLAKGYWGRRKNVWTITKNAVEKAQLYAYHDRKTKKRNFRTLWIQRINAGVRAAGSSYNIFMHQLKQRNIHLNRKVLADIAMNHPETFAQLVHKAGE